MISSARATGTLISTIADISFSPMMSSRIVPVVTSDISEVIGILLLEFDARLRQSPAHLLDVLKPDADAGTAELDGEADLARS